MVGGVDAITKKNQQKYHAPSAIQTRLGDQKMKTNREEMEKRHTPQFNNSRAATPVQARIPPQYLAPSCPDLDALGCHGSSHNSDIPCFIFSPDIKSREEIEPTENVYRFIHTDHNSSFCSQ